MKKIYFIFISIFLVTFLAYFQTLWMYFWIDDNALIYKLQHLDTYTGYWGKGIWGEGPYRHIIDQFVPFYPLFGNNPTPYYAIGIVLYFLTSLTVYFFIKLLTKDFRLGLLGAIIFAAGYVGSESIFGITNSWQTSRGIVMALLTFISFYQFIKTKRVLFYLISVILFFFSLDTVYVRAHGLIFSIIFFDLLFYPVIFSKTSIFNFILRQIPFIYIHHYIYLTSLDYAKRFGILNVLQDIFIDRKYQLLTIPFQNIGNLFIPDRITALVDQFIRQFRPIPAYFSFGSLLAGLLFFVLIFFIIWKFRQKENYLIRLLIFSVVWMLSNMVIFFVRETNLILQTTHRYLSYSFVGLTLFWIVLIVLISKNLKNFSPKKIQISLALVIIITYLLLGISYQYSFNTSRSLPARRFFADFQKVLPHIPKGTLIYMDVANDPKVKNEYNSFFGGMFSEAGNLAILGYVEDYTSDFLVTYKFQEVLDFLKSTQVDLEKVYAFYYSSAGLVDNSLPFRELLQNQKQILVESKDMTSNTPYQNEGGNFSTKTKITAVNGQYLGENSVVTFNLAKDVTSLVPAVLNFYMKISPQSVSFPYLSGKKVDISLEQKNKIFEYLIAKSQFQLKTAISAASFWREQEPKLAIDGRTDTSWRGHRGYWDEITRGHISGPEYLLLDLKKIVVISQLRFISAFPALIPTDYQILTSVDGQSWQIVKKIVGGPKLPSGSLIKESFKPTPARFIKMEIIKTYGNDGPEITEIEVVEDRFVNLDQEQINQLSMDPFGQINNLSEYDLALSFIRQNSKLRFWWMSDTDLNQDPTKYIDLPVIVDGQFHYYSINLPSAGLNWKKFTLEGFNFPSEVVISSPQLIYSAISP